MDSKWTKEQIFFDEDAKNKEFGTCYIIKKANLKVKGKKSKMFVFVFILLSICIGYFIFNISSNLVSMASSQEEENSAIIQAKDYYAVSMADFFDEVTANKVAEQSVELGGAGFVYQNQGKYYVLANVYDKENDALNVKQKLENKNYKQVSVVMLQGKKVDYTYCAKNNNISSQIILENLKFFDECFLLYKTISESFDKGETSFVEAKSKLFSSYNVYKEQLDKLVQYNEKSIDDKLQLLINCKQKMLDIMQTNSDVFAKENNFSANLKYASIQVVLNRISL